MLNYEQEFKQQIIKNNKVINHRSRRSLKKSVKQFPLIYSLWKLLMKRFYKSDLYFLN